MLSRHTHVVSDLATSNAHLARKPLLAHSWRSKVSGNSCPCGSTVHSSEQARSSRRAVKVFAATATSPRPKASPKKRKQVEPLLVAEDISKSHDGQRFLFENLNFTVSRGDRLALVGPNGAGKSSLFNLLSGAFSHSWRFMHWHSNEPLSCTVGQMLDIVVMWCRCRST
jgi:ATPase subunit of ABC transporter with duplicated ATPase domains